MIRFGNNTTWAASSMKKLFLILALFSFSVYATNLFSWDLRAIRKLKKTNKKRKIPDKALSSSLLELWILSNEDLKCLSQSNYPSVYEKNRTVSGANGDMSFYSSVVPYAFPCNNKPLGCKDYNGEVFNKTCGNDGLPWVICDGTVSHVYLRW